MKRTLRLSPFASVSELIGGGELVAFDIGVDRTAYFVIALRPLDYRIDRPQGSFAKTVPERPQDYRVIGLSASETILNVVIRGERFNIHHIQPHCNELLLVCGRSYYRGPDDFDKNGRVYTRNGNFARELLLGDGIQSVQTTSSGVIWTSFFDEGIFGNYGWENPIGVSGLVAWDSAGKKLYEFKPPSGLESICDCYALNVESDDDVWCYYYMDFPLVHLHRFKIEERWKMRLSGSGAFAVSAHHALFQGGYDDRETYHLYSLRPKRKVEAVAQIELHDQAGKKLKPSRVVGRSDALYLLCGNSLYRVDVQMALQCVS